jgi:hypothetical protein
MPVEGRDLSSRQTQYVVKDLEIGQPINSEECSETPAPQRSPPTPELQRSPLTEFSENGIGDGGQHAAPAGRAVDRAQGGAGPRARESNG